MPEEIKNKAEESKENVEEVEEETSQVTESEESKEPSKEEIETQELLKKQEAKIKALQDKLSKTASSNLTPRTKQKPINSEESERISKLEAIIKGMSLASEEEEFSKKVDKQLDLHDEVDKDVFKDYINKKKYNSKQAYAYLTDIAETSRAMLNHQSNNSPLAKAKFIAVQSLRDAMEARKSMVGDNKDANPSTSDLYNVIDRIERVRKVNAS